MPMIEFGYEFQGPFSLPGELPTYPGVYIVACMTGSQNLVLDIGQADNIRERIETHDRKDCWKKHCQGPIYYYATNVQNDLLRVWLENKLRQKYNPPCGER